MWFKKLQYFWTASALLCQMLHHETHTFWAFVIFAYCCGTKNSCFLNHFFYCQMLRHDFEKTHIFLTIFFAKCRCGKNECSMNHFGSLFVGTSDAKVLDQRAGKGLEQVKVFASACLRQKILTKFMIRKETTNPNVNHTDFLLVRLWVWILHSC